MALTIVGGPFSEYYAEVKDSVKTNLNQESDYPINDLYSEQMAETLMTKYIPVIPLWSGLMGKYIVGGELNPHNANIEANFKNLKHSTLRCRRNLCPSEYIRQYIHHNKGEYNNLVLINEKKISSQNKKRSTFSIKMEKGNENQKPQKVPKLHESTDFGKEPQPVSTVMNVNSQRSDHQKEVNPSSDWCKR